MRSRTSTLSIHPPAPHHDESPPSTSTASSNPSSSSSSSSQAGPSRSRQGQNPSFLSAPATTRNGRKSSKTISSSRPLISITSSIPGLRAKSYTSDRADSTPRTAPVHSIPSLLRSPSSGDGLGIKSTPGNPRGGLKRRLSTPRMGKVQLDGTEDKDVDVDDLNLGGPIGIKKSSDKAGSSSKSQQTRGRSTSTSMALPVILQESPTEAQPPSSYPPSLASFRQPSYSPFASVPSTEPVTSTSILTSAYNFGENSVLRLASWLRQPTPHRLVRRPSEDSEKGVGPGESEEIEIIDSVGSMRTSTESFGRDGQYWMDDGSTRGYFSLPRTSSPGYNDQYSPSASSLRTTLPTPALSTSSLSSSIGRKPTALGSPERHGWWSLVYKIWAGMIPQTAGGKTAEVIRDLGWTVALLAGVFIATASVALWLIRCMPITQLKHIPKSTTDLQLLSAEIRSYMASGDAGWYHTVGVLLFVGCWKHAWSVPGAVILNILVGSLLDPMPALFLLTIITATGSLFSYLLSRPLAPLIAVLFPKPLSLVRAALAPDSLPIPPSSGRATFAVHERITPIQISHDPTAEPLGSSNTSVWRRLLIMRAMGFVPWSGMNVACGVVGVDWKVFWLTTAAGSASWSYVTASVGNIISRLAIPQTSELVTGFDGDNVVSSAGGESLTSLLRDPVLITKMIFLSGLTLVPVILKRRSSSPSVAADGVHAESDRTSMDQTLLLSSGVGPKGPATGITSLDRLAPPPSLNPHRNHLHPAIPRLDMEPLTPNSSVPSSPLTDSLKKFTPTPAVFDLLSFGRTAARQGLRGAQGIGRKVASGIKGVSRDRH